MLMKVIGIGVTVFIIAKATKLGQEQLSYVTNITRIMTTQSELNTLGKAIYTEFLGADDCSMPSMSQREWADYIRAQMRSSARGRDCSKDAWQTPYTVQGLYDQRSGSNRGVTLRSAGPDTESGTDDDVVVTIRCRD